MTEPPWLLITTKTAFTLAARLARYHPLVIATPPDAVLSLGPGWLPSLAATCPAPGALLLADCGAETGYALASLRLGVGVVVPEVPNAAFDRLAALGTGSGLPVVRHRRPGLWLDGTESLESVARALPAGSA